MGLGLVDEGLPSMLFIWGQLYLQCSTIATHGTLLLDSVTVLYVTYLDNPVADRPLDQALSNLEPKFCDRRN